MAAVVPSADQATGLLKNLSLESQTKTLEIPEPTKKTSMNSGNGQVQPINRSGTPLIPDYMDPTVGYYPNSYASNAYYYGGYDGSTFDWEEYSKYMNPDGVDLSQGIYGYGYAPYGPYSPAGSPVPTVGQDGQFYSTQHYQYPNLYYPPLTPSGSPYPAAPNSKSETTTPSSADKSSVSVDPTNPISNGTKGNTGSAPVKPTPYHNSVYNANGSYGRGAQNSFQESRYGFDGAYSPVPWVDSSMYSDSKTRNTANNTPGSYGNSIASINFTSPRPMTGLNTASGYMNGMYQNKLYNQYGSTYRSGYGYGSNWLSVDNKYKPRGQGNGFFGYNNDNSDGLNELNRGPRTRTIKNQKLLAPIAIAVKGQTVTLPSTETIETEVKEVSLTPDREQYNKSDFPETYADAKFFIIKSYSEDDVHKSIKYNAWASTQNGNKKLDAAYKEAQQKSEPCPVFLFFSVNTSGQFVGVAEMVGPVDFDKSLEYWQQDKWIGCFPVKWHIVKDVPNSLLKHIILEYNENKPVTNSRDTQEVKLEQGLQVVKIFKEHSSKQCILDDFEFYEDRQKKIQEKKAKQQFQKQAWEGKPAIDEKINAGIKVEFSKSAEVVTDSVYKVKVADNVQDVAEKMVIGNGVANGC